MTISNIIIHATHIAIIIYLLEENKLQKYVFSKKTLEKFPFGHRTVLVHLKSFSYRTRPHIMNGFSDEDRQKLQVVMSACISRARGNPACATAAS